MNVIHVNIPLTAGSKRKLKKQKNSVRKVLGKSVSLSAKLKL